MTEIAMTLVLFNGVVMVLVLAILAARALLMGSGLATIDIEGAHAVQVQHGTRLLQVLIDAEVPVPASCGGKGTCGLCRVRVAGALDPPVANETAVLGSHALSSGQRLACQVIVRGDLTVGLPDGLPGMKGFDAMVQSSRHLTPLIKEIVLEVPASVSFSFRAGSFVQVTCPPYALRLGDLPIDEGVRSRWAQLQLDDVKASCTSATTRAYSLANHSGEADIVQLVVRLAVPPPGASPNTPAGTVSSWLFARRPGDVVPVAGPFGHFLAMDSDAEMVFVGGGAGMAPMRSHILEQLRVVKTSRKLSFWYGARTQDDLFYVEDFDALQQEFPNFSWSAVLSDAAEDDPVSRPRGFVHEHLHDAYLASHPSPASCEYYLCGPPLMIRAVNAMLERLGVPRTQIFFDDFGS